MPSPVQLSPHFAVVSVAMIAGVLTQDAIATSASSPCSEFRRKSCSAASAAAVFPWPRVAAWAADSPAGRP